MILKTPKAPSMRMTLSDCQKSLAEFAPAGANRVSIIFSGDMRGGENTARLANVRHACAAASRSLFPPGIQRSDSRRSVCRRRTQKPRCRSSGGVQLVQKPRRVSPPQRRKKVQSFSSATCAAKKILLGLQTCELSASGGQRVRCSQAAHPFVKK